MKKTRLILATLFLGLNTLFATQTIYLPYDNISFTNNKIVVYKDHKSAVIDKKGNLLTPFIQGEILYVFDGVYIFYQKAYYGVMDKKGRLIVKPDTYKKIRTYDDNTFRLSRSYYDKNPIYFNHKGEKVEIEKDKNKSNKEKIENQKVYKNTIIQTQGYYECRLIQADNKKVLVPFKKYETIDKFNKFDLAKVKKKSYTYGFINLKGQEVVAPIYKELRMLNIGFIAFKTKDNLWGLFDLKGNEVLKAQYDNIRNTNLSKDLAEIALDYRYGFINIDLKELIPPKYSYIRDISRVDNIVWLELNGEKKLVNSKLEILSEQDEYDYISSFYYTKDLLEVKKDNLRGLINKDGKIVIPLKYQYITNLKKEYIKVSSKDGYGVYDLKGKLIIPAKYRRLDYYDDIKLFRYINKDSRGVITLQGEVIDLTFTKNVDLLTNSIYAIQDKKTDKWGVINKDKKIILPYEYEDILYLSEDKILFKKDEKYGVMDLSGKVILKPTFDDLYKKTSLSNGNMLAMIKDKKIGFLSKTTGQIVIEPKYNYILDRRAYKSDDEYFIHIISDEGIGIINLSAQKVFIPAKYNDFANLQNGYIQAFKGKHWVIYDSLGNKLYEKKDKWEDEFKTK